MADVSIKIQLQDTIEDIIGGVSADKATNNVSSIVSKNTQKNDGTPLLSFAPGYIKFDVDGNLVNADGVAGRAILEGSYNGFVFGATNESGEYSVTLTITGSHIDSLIFYGDRLANQFPTEAYLDGDTANKIYSDDSIWAIVFDTSTTSHTVTFTKWNRANYNACFTHIAVLRNELWLDKAWIKNVESVSQCTGQPNEIFYGVIANSGSAEILDRNGELLDYITDGIIDNSNLPVSIWANGKQVQAHITNDSDYDTNSITLSFEMTNDFENWNSINYSGYNYPETSKSAYEMLVAVLSDIGYSLIEIDEMLDKNIIVGNLINENSTEMSIKSYLQSIIIQYPYLEADTVKNTIDKVCVLAQLQVYKDDDDKIKFISARPIATSNELLNTIVIPSKCQQSQFSENKILKNKYDAIEIDKFMVSNQVNFNTIVHSIYTDNPITYTENSDDIDITVSEFTISSDGIVSSYVYIKENYYNSIETISKYSEYNLKKILNIYTGLDSDGNNNIKSNIEYTLKTSSTSEGNIIITSYSKPDRFNNGSATGYVIEEDINDNFTETSDESGLIERENPISISNEYTVSRPGVSFIATANASTNLTNKDNLSTVEYTMDSDNNYVFNITTIVGEKTHKLQGFTTTSETPSSIQITGSTEEIIPKSLNITLYGDVREISFSKTSASSSNINESKHPISITSNELISDKTMLNNIEIVDIIKNNILFDYQHGIADATITITCSNYYDKDGNLIIDWSKGETVQVGNIVRVDKDNESNSASYYKDGSPRLWRVTGRTFRKQGVPLIDLELQEIISPISIAYEMTQTLKDCSISINRISSVVENVDLGIIDINTPIYYGDVIKITATPSTNKEIVTFKINSSDYLNNTEYTISGNINIECLCYGWEQVSDFESISIDTESGDTNIDINEQYSATISGIIADKDIRVWGYSEFYSVDGYYFNTNEGLFQGQGNLDYPNDTLGTINIYDVPQDPSSGGGGGAILGYIYISIKKPIENNKFIYTNYTTVGKNNAYLSKFIFTKIEQYL